MRKVFLFFIAAAVSFAAYSCSKDSSIVNPENTIKTPRQMTWTVDTLQSPDPTSIQLMMWNICAFSPNDIWICGWCDVSRGLIWHYDGKNWTESNISKDIGSGRVYDLVGYSSKDLWAGGFKDDVGDDYYHALFHYDGLKWTRSPKTGILGSVLDMTQDQNGNLLACGRNGTVFKYEQGKWIADSIYIPHSKGEYYWFNRMASNKDKIYLLATIVDKEGYPRRYFIKGNMNSWQIADSLNLGHSAGDAKWGQESFINGNSGSLYSVGQQGIWEYVNDTWVKRVSTNGSVMGGYAHSPSYMIAVGQFKQDYFFDGQKWDNFADVLPKIHNGVILCSAWTDGKEIFLVGYTADGFSKSVIYHGK